MEKDYDHQKVEDFVLGRLSSQEKKTFEESLQADQDLQKEVAFYRQMVIAAENVGEKKMAALFEKVDNKLSDEGFFSQTEKSKARVVKMSHRRRRLSIAASILLLVSMGSWWLARTNYSNQALVGNYSIGFNGDNIRGINDTSQEGDFVKGVNAFKVGNYRAAIQFFKNIPDDDDVFIESNFYLGQLYTITGDYDNALNPLELVVQSDDKRFKEKAEWQIVLTSLLADDPGNEIKELLFPITQNPNHSYHKHANQLSRDLKSFWRVLANL